MSENKITLPEILANENFTPELKAKYFQWLVNQEPPKNWLKDHPMAKGMKYLPIDKLEWLVNKVYLASKIEIKSVTVAANAMMAIVTVGLLNPVTKEWEYNDGCGAATLQTKQGAGAVEFDKLNSSAVQMAAPAAVTYAKKDALENFGRIFGRDINRRDLIVYESPDMSNAEITKK